MLMVKTLAEDRRQLAEANGARGGFTGALLARGVEQLAQQMMRSDGYKLALAAGVDDEQHRSANAVKVMEGDEAVAGGNNVLVLMDLSNALLSAGSHIDLLDRTQPPKVTAVRRRRWLKTPGGGGGRQLSLRWNRWWQAQGAQASRHSWVSTDGSVALRRRTVTWTVQNPHGRMRARQRAWSRTLAPFRPSWCLGWRRASIRAASINWRCCRFVTATPFALIADVCKRTGALAAFKALAEQHFGETVSERQRPSPAVSRGEASPADRVPGHSF